MAKCKRNRNKTKRNFTVKTPTANRNYKDTVFRMLFSDRKNLLSLYNAVNQSDYNNPDDLEIVTLENAIYMGMKNDLAFIMDTNLYLYEHQSTIIDHKDAKRMKLFLTKIRNHVKEDIEIKQQK